MVTATDVPAIIEKAFPYTIEKKRLFGPDREETDCFGLFRSDGVHVGRPVTDIYEPHTLDDVQAQAEAAVSAFPNMPLSVQCTWRDGHNVVIGPTTAYRREISGQLFPRFILRAGVGSTAFDSSLAAWKDNCSNLMLLSQSDRVHKSIRHTASLRTQMPEMIEDFRELSGGWESLASTAKQMEERTVNMADFIREVYPIPEEATSRTMHLYSARVTRIISRISNEARAEQRTIDYDRISAWDAYNGVQGYVQHEQRRNGKPNKLNRALVALKDSSVNRALELALSM